MKYRKLLAVGDSHGHYSQLKEAVERSGFDPTQDFMVFLGDYIDRGQEPLKCLDYVRQWKENYPDRVVVLKGNHEDMMDEYFLTHNIASDISDFMSDWMYNGGETTFKALSKYDMETRKSYLEFIRSLPTKHVMPFHDDNGNNGNIIFCHAGINPLKPLDKQSDFDLLWIREQFLNHYSGNDIVVVGHTMVQSLGFEPYPIIYGTSGNIIMCDTGSYLAGGHVSCVDVLAGEVFQSQEIKSDDCWYFGL